MWRAFLFVRPAWVRQDRTMEGLLILLGVVIFIGGPIMGWVAVFSVKAMRDRIAALEARIAELDGQAPRTSPGFVPEPPRRQPTPARAEPTPAAPLPAPVLARSLAPEGGDAAVPKPFRPPALATAESDTPAPRESAIRVPQVSLDWENLLGARGFVWIGGLALLLGAVFLLRYTIEAGLLTPAMRVGLAALMGVVALAASEILSRRDLSHPVAQRVSERADIPAILAAVGVFSLFGAVYAAHALYALLGATPATLGMGVVALGGMALSLRRGAWLAAIGLVGALATPLLVASVTPSYLGVFAYVAIITAAALAVARIRSWDWLVLASAVGAAFWLAMLSGKAVNVLQLGVWALGVAAVLALAVRALLAAPTLRPGLDGPDTAGVLSGWAGVGVLAFLAAAAGDDVAPLGLVLPFAMFTALIGLSQWRAKLWPSIPLAALAILCHPVVLGEDMQALLPTFRWTIAAVTLLCASVIAAMIRTASALDDDTGDAQWIFVVSMLTGGLAIVIALVRFGLLGDSVGIGGVIPEAILRPPALTGMAVLALLAAGLALITSRAKPSAAALWTAALGVTAMVLISDPLWQRSLIASVGAAGAVAITLRRDNALARVAPVGLLGVAGLIALIAVAEPADVIGTTPVLNALWLYLGLPGGIAAAAGYLFSRRSDGLWAQALVGGAIVFSVLLAAYLIHHAASGGRIDTAPGFASVAAQLLASFALLLGGSWVRSDLTRWDPSAPARERIVPCLLIGTALFSLAVFALLQLLALNPLFNPDSTVEGHPVFNALFLGFALPAVLLGASALRYAGHRPLPFVRMLSALSGLSALVWVTAQIRRLFQGPQIALPSVPWNSAELYSVSAAWIAISLLVLAAGIKTRRRDLRLASAVLLVATTVKVFLVDMSELDGALRAASFIGLGVVLLGIGLIYQRLLAREAPREG